MQHTWKNGSADAGALDESNGILSREISGDM